MPISIFQPIRLLDLYCSYKFKYFLTNSVDPDQLASSAVYPGSAGPGLRGMDTPAGGAAVRIICLPSEKRSAVKQKIFFPFTLRKHACSHILKILPPKNENFQIKNSDIFISAQNTDCGYLLELPQ